MWHWAILLLAPDNSNKTLGSLEVWNNESLQQLHTALLTYLSTPCSSTDFSLLVPFVLPAQRNALEWCIAWLIGVTHCTIVHWQFPETTPACTSSVGVRWNVNSGVCAPGASEGIVHAVRSTALTGAHIQFGSITWSQYSAIIFTL